MGPWVGFIRACCCGDVLGDAGWSFCFWLGLVVCCGGVILAGVALGTGLLVWRYNIVDLGGCGGLWVWGRFCVVGFA